jgi:methionyl-tRNA synthetase
MSKRFYVTTPIYYVNDRPHIGHASTTVWADVWARFARAQGRDVFFLTGVDEHGLKVQQSAEKRGVDPQKHCDEMVGYFREMLAHLNVSNNDFVRTTSSHHKETVRRVLSELNARGAIYRKKYRGWYSRSAEQFVTEKEMVDGRFPSHYGEVIEIEEENYFFRMSEHQSWLIQYIRDHPEWIQPENRKNEILGLLQKPLEDLCISRPKSRLGWGIPIPFDESYVTYVWVDALVNYISYVNYGTQDFAKSWPANCHLIGKEILTTHSVYWPTILHALDLPMPKRILAHGWWLFDHEKMSKSLGNVVDPKEYIDRFGVDAVRYFICRELQLANDSDFTEDRFVQRFNSDLANDLGNLVNRSISMLSRYRDGVVPAGGGSAGSDDELKQVMDASQDDYLAEMERIALGKSLDAIWKIVVRANRYVEENAPWKLAKDPSSSARLDQVLHLLIQVAARLSVLIDPFLPVTAARIRAQLAVESLDPQWKKPGSAALVPSGHKVGKAEPLFPRQTDDSKK